MVGFGVTNLVLPITFALCAGALKGKAQRRRVAGLAGKRGADVREPTQEPLGSPATKAANAPAAGLPARNQPETSAII